MSTCISRAGEYSSHTPSDHPFICGLCFAFDEDAALTALRTAEADRDAYRARIDKVRALLPAWERDVTGYPTTQAGMTAAAAVVLCGKELRAALDGA